MAVSPRVERPTTFTACPACAEATTLLRAALLQVDPHTTSQLVVSCLEIHRKDKQHPGTATMNIVASERLLKSETVYCPGAPILA